MPDEPLSEHDTLVEYRLAKLEETQRDLMVRSEGWHNNLGAQITALSNQIGTALAALPATYTPRPEAEQRHKVIEEHFKAMEQQMLERRQNVDQRVDGNTKRIERIEGAGWAVAIGMMTLLLGVVFAIFKSTVGG